MAADRSEVADRQESRSLEPSPKLDTDLPMSSKPGSVLLVLISAEKGLDRNG